MIVVTHEEDVARHSRRIIRIRDGLIASDERLADTTKAKAQMSDARQMKMKRCPLRSIFE